MALSGSLSTTKYESNRYYKLTWSATQSTANNKSTINWTLSAENSTGNNNWYAERTLILKIAGSTVYSKTDRVERYKGTIATGTKEITHNTDGSKSFSASIEAAVVVSSVNVTGSDSFTLNSIPRYATSSQSLNSKTETTIKMNWSSDSTIDYIWYSKDNGSNWTGVDVTDGKSGTYTISSLSANTTYNIKTRVRRKDSQLTTDSSALSVTTYNYPYCTETPNFVLGNKVKLKFYNPLKRTFKFYIVGNGVELSNEYTCSSDNYEGLESGSIVNPLYETIPNSQSGKYKIKVVYGSSTKTRDNSNTFTVNESECTPTFTGFNYMDVDALTVYLTQDNQTLVKGQSKVKVLIPAHLQMVTKKGATPKKYVVSLDGATVDCGYSATTETSSTLNTISMAGNRSLTVTAYDSRGLYYTVVKNVYVYDYEAPTVNATATRLNSFENETTLSVSGKYWGFGICSIQNVQYQYRETGGEWTRWWDFSTTKSNGEYTCRDVVLNLDNTKSYEINITASDNIKHSQITLHVDVGQATFFMCTNKKAFYVDTKRVLVADDETDYAPVTDYIVEQGTTDILSWEKWKSGKVELWGNVNVTYLSANVLSATIDYPFNIKKSTVNATIQSVSGNNSYAFPRTVKAQSTESQLQVAVQDPDGTFISSSTLPVGISIKGNWK